MRPSKLITVQKRLSQIGKAWHVVAEMVHAWVGARALLRLAAILLLLLFRSCSFDTKRLNGDADSPHVIRINSSCGIGIAPRESVGAKTRRPSYIEQTIEYRTGPRSRRGGSGVVTA